MTKFHKTSAHMSLSTIPSFLYLHYSLRLFSKSTSQSKRARWPTVSVNDCHQSNRGNFRAFIVTRFSLLSSRPPPPARGVPCPPLIPHGKHQVTHRRLLARNKWVWVCVFRAYLGSYPRSHPKKKEGRIKLAPHQTGPGPEWVTIA